MNPEQKEQLENEQIEGRKAQQVYDSFIKEFVEGKRIVLFESFRMLPLTAESELMEIKRMLYAVDTLEDEIRSVIQTGQMASKTLNESIEEVTH